MQDLAQSSPGREGRALDKLHYQIVRDHIVQVTDVGMIQRGYGPRELRLRGGREIWFWLTTEGGSCISTSPPIRRRSGPRSSSGRPFALSRSLVTCFGTATGSSAVRFGKM